MQNPPQSPQTPSQQLPSTTPGAAVPYPAPAPPRPGLNIVVLDPAHGGTDPGARGTGGVRESEIVLDFAAQVRRALESQGFQVMQTRNGNENPSLDDRSALANAQSGAVFITLHVASTGIAGTVRTYALTDLPATAGGAGLIPWEFAQAPYIGLSRKLGDQVQSQIALQFRGSPNAVQLAAVRQLRTTAAPAIAVEISSVVMQDRADLDRMFPGIADAIARGVSAFRPAYVTPAPSAGQP